MGFCMTFPALDQLSALYTNLVAAGHGKKKGEPPREVRVYVRVQEQKTSEQQEATPRPHKITIERKHFGRDLLMWITRASHQYKFEQNVSHFENLLKQGLQELATKDNPTEKELNEVLTCLRYYQELVEHYANRHQFSGTAQKNTFLNDHLFSPFQPFLDKLTDWQRGDDAGKKLFADYAMKVVETTKERVRQSSGEERTSSLNELFFFLREATQIKEFSSLDLSPLLLQVWEKVKGSSLEKQFNEITSEWKELTNPQIRGSIDAHSLHQYLQSICKSLNERLSDLEKLPSAQQKEEPSKEIPVAPPAVKRSTDESELRKRMVDETRTLLALARLLPDTAKIQAALQPLAEETSTGDFGSINEHQRALTDILQQRIYALPHPEHGPKAKAWTELCRAAEKAQIASDLLRLFERLGAYEEPTEVSVPEGFVPIPPKEMPREETPSRTDTPPIAARARLPVRSTKGAEDLSALDPAQAIEDMIRYIEQNPDFPGKSELLSYAQQKGFKTTDLFTFLVAASNIMDLETTTERQSQLRLWALHALKNALSNKKPDDAQQLTQFCTDAHHSLIEVGKTQDAINIGKFLAAIETSYSSVLSYIEQGEKIYQEVRALHTSLSDPSTVSPSELTWSSVRESFIAYRQHAEEQAASLKASIETVQASASEVEEQHRELSRLIGQIQRSYGTIPGINEALSAIALEEKPQESSLKEWHDTLSHACLFAKNLQSILAMDSAENEAVRHLTRWMLFAVARAYEQYGKDPAEKGLVALLAIFSNQAYREIQEASSKEPENMESWLDTLESRFRALEERSLSPPLPSLPGSFLPDPTSAPPPSSLASLLNWQAIARTWKNKREEQREAYSAFERQLETAELKTAPQDSTIRAIEDSSKRLLEKRKGLETIVGVEGSLYILGLLPQKGTYGTAPIERLQSLLAILRDIERCLQIASAEQPSFEYQQQAARIFLNNLVKQLHPSPSSAPLQIRTLLWPPSVAEEKQATTGPRGEEIFETIAEGTSSSAAPKDMLYEIETLVNVEAIMRPVSETSRRNLSSELDDIGQLLVRFPQIKQEILEEQISLPAGSPTKKSSPPSRPPTTRAIGRTTVTTRLASQAVSGQVLLADIEARLSSRPSSLKELQSTREKAATALSALRSAVDRRLNQDYQKRIKALEKRLSELREDRQRLLTEHDAHLLRWYAEYLKSLPPAFEDTSFLVEERSAILEGLVQMGQRLPPIPTTQKKGVEERYRALVDKPPQHPDLLKTWQDAQRLYQALLNPPFSTLHTTADIDNAFQRTYQQLTTALDRLEEKNVGAEEDDK